MDTYRITTITESLKGNRYPGRGIIIGKTSDGAQALGAYFIMGRSSNSRNRVFAEKNGAIFTEPFDPSKVEDPSLIIYAAVRQQDNNLIITNGDQTDTICEGLSNGLSFQASLQSRQFEPDRPNYTPRISGMLTFTNHDFAYQMSILKSIDAQGSACARYTFAYPAAAGLGHFIHTYMHDGDPIPTFQGEPERISIGNDIDTITQEIWNSLDADNRISLFVRSVDHETGKAEDRLINKYMKG